MTSPKVIAVVPAHNEGRTVGAVVTSLKQCVDEVVVVNDNSSDTTREMAEAADAIVVSRERDPGYDLALNEGFRVARERGAEIFITFDADGEHDIRDVPRILGPILSGDADIVIGERPHTRHLGEEIFSLYTRLRFGIRDPLCGMKAYRREVYDTVGYFDSVRSVGTELMLRGLRRGFRLSRVAITLHARENDTSRFYALRWRGTLRILKAMLSVVFI